MLRPKIGLDWDDVTAPFNSLAIQMANEKYNITPPLVLEDIDSWENSGRAGVIKEFYTDEELYQRQIVPERTKNYCCLSGIYGNSCKANHKCVSGASA